MNFKLRHKTPDILKILIFILLGCLLLSIAWTGYYAEQKVKTTPQMLFYKFDNNNRKDSTKLKVEYEWVDLDSISRNVVLAILASQDPNFYLHDGFALLNPSDSTASKIPPMHETISQRTAHSVFLTAGDSRIKELMENYFTMLIEYMWGKDRILEIYLNTSLMGNGIFGIEAASHIYFNKSAGNLTVQEAAFIAAIMEFDSKYINLEKPDDKILLKQNEILGRMGLMIHIKKGKTPIDEKETLPARPIYRRQWRG